MPFVAIKMGRRQGGPILTLAEPEVEHFDRRGKCHREINITPLDVLTESVGH
jgi:hypothetical protein